MVFGLIVAVLIALAIFWLAPTLLREHHLAELDRRAQNVDIARERMDEIAAEHASGAMTDEIYEQSKSELEASLLDDVETQDSATEQSSTTSSKYGKFALIIIAVLVPISTLAMYQYLGSPQYLEYQGASAGQSVTAHGSGGQQAAPPATMEELIERLKQRLEQNPEDGEGWFLLARTYMAEERYTEALQALRKTHAIFGDHPAILLGLADAMAMTKQGNLTGEASELIDRALEMEPGNSTGLWLGGMAAQQNGKFQLAVDRWAMLIPMIEEDAKSQMQLKELIDNAVNEAQENGIEVKVSMVKVPTELPTINNPDSIKVDAEPVQNSKAAPVAEAGAPAIKAWVSLDQSIAANALPTDTVFVFAKAVAGPPMPLAAFKTTVAELPMEVTLDDSMAMMPQMKISSFEEVAVSARVSKSGQPRESAGDLVSAAVPVKVSGMVGIELTINNVVE